MQNDRFSVTVKIPVKSHVKKYLSERYGIEHTLTKTTLLGILVFNVLDKKLARPIKDFSDYDEKYAIVVPQRYFNERGFAIDLRKRRFLAICLEKVFNEDFHLFIDTVISSKLKVSAVQAMKIFLKKYQITENEAKFETLYRNYQRYCKENITQKKKLLT